MFCIVAVAVVDVVVAAAVVVLLAVLLSPVVAVDVHSDAYGPGKLTELPQ